MELTFFTELGESFVVEIDENMELENVMALLEAEVSSAHARVRQGGTSLSMLLFSSFVKTQLIAQSHPAPPLRPCIETDHRGPTFALSVIVRHPCGRAKYLT